ncbi:MAG TPA: type II toxin-antitoxin system Phd/YefM family antitoxin [Thermomicrobiales bacterium]|nr:type II toxin-antitoxin system Phd/YefM family antitoxin [Thermomicrobiales bacterium]
MTDTTISASEARRAFGKVLDRVSAGGESIVIERRGEPVAAVASIGDYRQWQSQREAARARLGAFFETVSERADIPPHEADAFSLEVGSHIRATRKSHQ